MHILLAEHEPTVRSALRLLLEQEPWVDTVSEAGDSRDLAAAMHKSRADIVLFDYEMAGIKPQADFIGRLHTTFPGLRVIALSSHSENERQALASGADAFVSKGDSPGRVLAVVAAVAGRRKEMSQ
jgi:DNA-binding NarL/FixJ family response regulator